MCKYADVLSWNKEEACQLQGRPCIGSSGIQTETSPVWARKEAGQITQGSFSIRWEVAKIWYLSSQWLSCPKSNAIQIMEEKEKIFPFAESKRNGNGFCKCISDTICYIRIGGCSLEYQPESQKRGQRRDIQREEGWPGGRMEAWVCR